MSPYQIELQTIILKRNIQRDFNINFLNVVILVTTIKYINFEYITLTLPKLSVKIHH